MKKILTVVMAMCIGLLALTVSPAMGTEGTDKVGVCHRTASDSNPYTYIEVPRDEANGHITGESKQHNDNVTWKSDGEWNGVKHSAGDSKLDYYAEAGDKESKCAERTETPEEPEVVGSTYAFAEQGNCDAPGYIQINYVKGVDWTIEGEAVTVTDPSSRFTYPGGIQAEVKATAQDGYVIADGQQSTYFLQVNPQPRGNACEQPVDVCSNIDGNQSEVPDGMVKDENGNCVTPEPPVCDDECKIPFVKTAAPKVTECRGVLAGEVLRNVVVPRGASCTLVDSHVNGSVRSTGGRNVTLADTTVRKNVNLSRVSGDVTFGSKGHACRYDPYVGGSLIVKKSHNVLICQASVCDDIVVQGNDGKITVRESSANKIKVRYNRKFVRDSGDRSHNRLSLIRLIDVDGKVVAKHNSPRKVVRR